MGMRYMLISDIVLDEWKQIIARKKKIETAFKKGPHDYWTEPPVPPDFKIVHSEHDIARELTKFTVSSYIYETIPSGGEIPIVDFIIHLGKKPTQPFLFR